MQAALYTAALLLVAIGIAHSWLGERYILMRLFRRDDLPILFGSADFTIQTLRFAWHLTTIAWWGFAAMLVLLAHPPVAAGTIGMVTGCVFLLHFAIALTASRARHLSWIIFLIVGFIAIYATRG